MVAGQGSAANGLYKLFINLLFELYGRRYPIALKAEWHAKARLAEASAVRLDMTGTLIMEVLCVAGVLFMIRFLVALFREDKPKSPSRVVYLSAWPTAGRNTACFTRAGERAGAVRAERHPPPNPVAGHRRRDQPAGPQSWMKAPARNSGSRDN